MDPHGGSDTETTPIMREKADHLSIQRFIDGFQRGESEFYDLVRRKVGQYVNFHVSGEPDYREELIAEVLAALVECFKQGRFRGDSLRALNVYIFNMIRNRVAVARRKRRSIAEPIGEAQISTDNPAATVADTDFAGRVYQALDEKCARILRLRFHSGWTNPEIADQLNMSINAVSTAISRCLDRARNLSIVKDLLQ